MKAIEKKYYVCAACSKKFNSADKAQECQASHKDIANSLLELGYRRGKPLPERITFTFGDGTSARYIYKYSRSADGQIDSKDA